MTAARWKALPARDRQVLAAGGIAVTLLLGWAFVWHPLVKRRAELATQMDSQRRELAYVRQASAEIERLRATGVQARGDRMGKSLLALADASAREAGLERSLRQVEPAGDQRVRVRFENAPFDPLVAWIEALSRQYGVEAIELSAERADGIGIVHARVTLQDAP